MDESVVFKEREGSVMAGGTQLGSKYFLGRQLGRGAMGVVYDATTTGGQSLAIKLLRPELASDDKTVARFVQERQIFRRIDHPNVVRVDDLVAEGDQLGIAMEKVSGGDLRQRAEARSLTPSEAMRIAADVAAGLEAIHAADVVHRDLKPANILIAETDDGLQPKISDFGISRLVSEAMTRTSTTIGTPLYMAPEAADKRGAEAPADIYSLGAMMFELLIGTAPFHEGGTFAVLRAHAQDAPPFIDGVPPELAGLIDHMLAKDPAARPTATAVRERLIAIIPRIDDTRHPVAIERADGGAADSGATAVVDLTDGSPSDSAETRISSDDVIERGLAGLAGGAAGAAMAGPGTTGPGTTGPGQSNPPVPATGGSIPPGGPAVSNPGRPDA
ncbi:MAG: serine/threonine-protein kinase, partial [Acidimicrobiales bacterium]